MTQAQTERTADEWEGFSSESPVIDRFGEGRYAIRVAGDLESREKAYRLIYRLYREKGYAEPKSSGMWIGPYDAQSKTVTLLVERTPDNAAVGALTVVFDSQQGLPADDLYRPELDSLRSSGHRLSEIISLGVEENTLDYPQFLIKLFNLAYLTAYRLRGATDLIITVNPRHTFYYEKTMLFETAGPERSYGKVNGAPAVLLRLNLAVPEDRIRLEHGPAEFRPPRSTTVYPLSYSPMRESAIIAALAGKLRPMTEREIEYFFTDLSERYDIRKAG